jgi:uncharacterized protein (TIGR02646 family)
MRNIVKSSEPKSLETHRCSAYASYDNYDDKQSLRVALVAEQRGLCCYCMTRLAAGHDTMKIEHWQSQEAFPKRQLDYSNLLGACLGGEGKPPKRQHCDTRKGKLDLSRNPANPAHDVERIIHYDSDGTIRSTDPVFEREINDVLNLNNAPWLKTNRKAALTGFLEAKPKHGDWDNNMIEKWLKELSGDLGSDELSPYCQIVVYWLRKRLNRGKA